MTRYEANIQILDIIKDYITKYPDMRFGQALSNLDIATHKWGCPEGLEHCAPVDIFFEESDVTFRNLTQTESLKEGKPKDEKFVGDASCFVSIDVSKIPEGVSLEEIIEVVKLHRT